MRNYLFTGWIAICAGSTAFAALPPPVEIGDAPVEDAVATEITSAKAAGPGEFRFTQQNANWQSRVYTFSVIEYAHIASYASPLFVNNGLTRRRSARQELNAEWQYHPNPAWILKADMQWQYSTAFEQSTVLYDRGAQDWAKVNELFIERRLGERFAILAGKYRRVFGPGIFHNPMDAHNPLPAMPGAPTQREGAWQLQASLEPGWVHAFARDYKLSLAFLPRYFQDKNGWPTSKTDVIDYESSRTQNGGIARVPTIWDQNRIVWMTRFYANVYGGDANVVNYKESLRSLWGVSYQRYVHPMLEIHAEGLYATAAPDITAVQRVQALGGMRVEFDNDSGIIFEYLFQGRQASTFPVDIGAQRELMTQLLNTESRISPNTPLREYLMFSAYRRNIRDRAGVTFNAIYGVGQGDAVLSLRIGAKVGGVANLSLMGSRNVGGAGSYFGSVVPNDWRVGSELQVTF